VIILLIAKPETTATERRYSVLYAEDDAGMRRSYARFLEGFFKDVYEAGDGATALELYDTHRPDVVITDISMPRLDGLSLIQQIRRSDRRTKAVVLTAFTDHQKLLLATELHLSKYLEKPVRIHEFQAVLGKVIAELDDEADGTDLIRLKEGYSWNRTYKRLLYEQSEIALTPSEVMLLDCLAEARARILTYEEIMGCFQRGSREKELTENSLKAIVKRLRKKLPVGSIENVFGVGYRLIR
jgi:two-component system, OmpR family, response regulator VanR